MVVKKSNIILGLSLSLAIGLIGFSFVKNTAKKETLERVSSLRQLKLERQSQIVGLYKKRAQLLMLGYQKGYFKNSDAKALLSRADAWQFDLRSYKQVEEVQVFIDQFLGPEINKAKLSKEFKQDLERIERDLNRLRTSLRRIG